jgi:8-oxo-dGTP diphosphatase
LGIKIKVGGRLIMVDHKYPSFDIRLCAMKAEIVSGELHPSDHDKVMWVQTKELLSLDLTPADKQIAKVIC